MHSADQLQEYYNFLTWFKLHYPALSTCYWQFITIPLPGEGVKLTASSLDSAVYNQLQQIEYDYYHPWQRRVIE